MDGQVSDAEKNLKVGNKFNSNTVKISSSKSILSYQNGSAVNTESRESTGDEGAQGDEYPEDTPMTEEPLPESQNLKSECLDLLRKKLISDLSLTVFSTDLENKLTKMEPIEINKERQSVIQKLLIQISQLSDAEKLLLYLKLPSSTSSPFDPLRQPLNPLGNRQEIQQTIVWIKTHLEEDSEISIPKQDVYNQYLKYCENVSMKPLSTADFGKVMKQVYPGVRPRRLGTRGNSRYCYSGMRNTCRLPTPILPQSSINRSVLNGNSGDGSSNLSAEISKCKKLEKPKRKWKSSGCRSEKCTSSRSACSALEKDSRCHLKNTKRTKTEEKDEDEGEDVKSKDVKNVKGKTEEVLNKVKEEVNLCGIKCEESSDNSFNAFDIECGLGNDFGIYFENVEKIDKSPTDSATVSSSSSGTESDAKQNGIQKTSVLGGEPQQKTVVENSDSHSTQEHHFSLNNVDQTEKVDIFQNHIVDKSKSLNGSINSVSDQSKTNKGRSRRSASFSKTPKNFKKSYVPIQPKPVEAPKLNVLLEPPIGIGNVSAEPKLDSESLTLCEESDSQEPEEEIVRYFQHLEESEMNAESFIDQAVKNIENSSVQISNMSQIISKNPVSFGESGEVLNQTTQQSLRSQSCFEVNRGMLNLSETSDSVYVPRSQSSVELPTLTGQSQQDGMESDSVFNGKKKKISHLRVLLEKSISTGSKNPYSNLKGSSNLSSNCNPVMSNAQISNSVSQLVSSDPNFSLSNTKSCDRDLLKLNGLKIVSKGHSFVPQSPNTRTKYFSFTPISPGPQSPLKTPSTPSASPFVSPRSTPVPRFKQNSYNDFFLSPSEKKSPSLRTDGGKSEMSNENTFNFSKTTVENTRAEGSKAPTYLHACRPRSFSSTNFYRSKARRNSKVSGYNAVPSKNRIQAASQSDFSGNSQFSIHRNFLSSDSISNEVRKFLDSNSKLSISQSASIRSQSVPLNRMISESTWVPTQVSPFYSGYCNSGSSNPSLASVHGKFPDWVTNTDTNAVKEASTNMTTFVNNETGSFSNEVFSRDAAMVHLGDQYFPGDFPSEESAFNNKLDLNTSGTFESAFASDSDHIKSYLPDFEGIDNKTLPDMSEMNNESVVTNERKFFKNALYEGGNENVKDPVITSFKPVLMSEMSDSADSPVLNFFGTKINEDNQQLIEFFDFED